MERAIRARAAPTPSRGLTRPTATSTRQFDEGVGAYERLVAAAAGYVAEDGRTGSEHPSVSRLTEASDLLRGVADRPVRAAPARTAPHLLALGQRACSNRNSRWSRSRGGHAKSAQRVTACR